MVSFQLSTDSVIGTHGDLTHQVRLLHVLLHELSILLLLLLGLGELLLLSVPVGRLLESIVSGSTEDARSSVLVGLLLMVDLLLRFRSTKDIGASVGVVLLLLLLHWLGSTEDAGASVLVLSLLLSTHLHLLLLHLHWLLLHLLLGNTLTDHAAHALVVVLHLLHVLLLLLRFGFLVASTEGERRATAGRGKDTRG